MKKKVLYSELSYILGLIILALGTSIIEKAGFGMSMVVSPAYLIHLKLSVIFPFFSFGMAEYCFQGLLIIILSFILGKFRLNYLYSFVTAVIYGFLLDGFIYIFSFISENGLALRILLFVLGLTLCTLGISLLLGTYISPEAYELFVKKISKKYNYPLFKTKFLYDISSLTLSIILSLSFFGSFKGIGIGTVITAVLNGRLIGMWTSFIDKHFISQDVLKLRKFFEND